MGLKSLIFNFETVVGMAGDFIDQFTPSFKKGGNGRLFINTAVVLGGIWALTSIGLGAAGVPPLQAIFNPVADAGGLWWNTMKSVPEAIVA